MKTPTVLLVSGAIAGIGVGLLLGHFVRTPRLTTDIQSVQSVRPLLPPQLGIGEPDNGFLSIPDIRSPYFDEFSSGLEEDETQTPNPLQNAVSFQAQFEELPGNELPPVPNQLIPIETLPQSAEPQPLPLSDAVPLTKNSPADQKTIQGIIDIELSHLPAEKRQVWFDALKETKKEDVPGILKMWKLLGGPIPGIPTEIPSSLPMSPAPPVEQHPTPPELSFDSRFFSPGPENIPAAKPQPNNLVDEAEKILLRNLLNQNTSGYIPRVPCFVENETGEYVVETRLDFRATQHVYTGFPLDLAIKGPGFFVVADENGTHYLTRNGHFTLDAEKFIALKVGTRWLRLQPEIALNQSLRSEKTGLEISSNGLVETSQRNKEGVHAINSVGFIQICTPLSLEMLAPVGNELFIFREEHQEAVLVTTEHQNHDHIIWKNLELPTPVNRQIEENLKELRSLMAK